MITIAQMAMVLIGLAFVAAAGMIGCQFYPPGYGYEEEKRNDRISRIMMGVAVLFLLSAFFV